MGPARAVPNTEIIVTRGDYVPGDNVNHVPAILVAGSSIEFRNLDAFAWGPHTFTADATDHLGNPIFDSGSIDYQQTATVDVSTVPVGVYGFHCNVHSMYGTLCVIGTDGAGGCAPHA